MANSKEIAGFLVVLSPLDLATKLPLRYGNNIVGRTENKATLVLKQISISQKHASLYVAPNRLTLTDLGSKNGTKINGEANFLEQGKQIVVDESMVIYFADVKCKIEITEAKKVAANAGGNIETKQVKDKKRAEMMSLFDDEQEAKPKQNKGGNDTKGKTVRDEYEKPNIRDDFDIEDGFEASVKKEVEPHQKKKDNKKVNSKLLEPKEKNAVNEEADKRPAVKVKVEPKNEIKEEKISKADKKKNIDTHKTIIVKEEDKPTKSLKGDVSRKELKKKSPGSPVKKEIQKKESPSPKGNIKVNQEEKFKKDKKPGPQPPLRRSSQRLSLSKEKEDKKQEEKVGTGKVKIVDLKEDKKAKSKGDDKKHSVSPQRQKSRKSQNQKGRARSKKANEQLKKEQQSCETNLEMQQSTTKKKHSRKRKLDNSLDREVKMDSEVLSNLRNLRNFIGRRILCSDFIPQLHRKFFQIVQDPTDEFDFLVMKTYKRTIKVLIAICRGITIVSSSWTTASQQQERILKYEYHLFDDINHIYSAIQKAKNGKPIFDGYDLYLASKQYHLKTEDLETLIGIAGGHQLKKSSKQVPKQKRDRSIALVMNFDKKMQKQFESDVHEAKKQGFQKIYAIDFLFDSCEYQQIDWQKNQISKIQF